MMLLDEWRRLMEAVCYVNALERRRMPRWMSQNVSLQRVCLRRETMFLVIRVRGVTSLSCRVLQRLYSFS